MANPYPVELSVGSVVKEAGSLSFTDPGNQPGGSLPDPVPQSVHIAPVDPADAGDLFSVTAPAGFDSEGSGNVAQYYAENGDSILYVDNNGGVIFGLGETRSASIRGSANGTDRAFVNVVDGAARVFIARASASAGQTMVLFNVITEPIDDVLESIGDCVLWVDPTTGSAKLNIKSKDNDGNIVRGSINLT